MKRKLLFIFSILVLNGSLFSQNGKQAAPQKKAAPKTPSVSEQRQKLVDFAMKQQGKPYVLGSVGPNTFDCSGFIKYVCDNGIYYKEKVKQADGKIVNKMVHLKVEFPRTADGIYNAVVPITEAQREPGDLMFFKDGGTKISHVGIYCGVYHGPRTEYEGKRVFISALSSGTPQGIQLRPIDNKYWKDHFYCYGRILPSTADYNKGVKYLGKRIK